MTAVIAGILAVLMVIGGILPNYSNSTVEEALKATLNNPEKIEVKVFSTPSYKLLGGSFDRVEINATKTKFLDYEFDSLKVITSKIELDYSQKDSIKFIKNGNMDAMLILSAESISKKFDIQSVTTKINNLLSNLKIPLPIPVGSIFIDGLKITFFDNKPKISGNFIAMGGFFSAPFSVTGELIVTAKNTVELYKPQFFLYDNPLIIEQIQDLLKLVNPVFDVNKYNTPNMNIKLRNLYFKDNKIKLIGSVNINN